MGRFEVFVKLDALWVGGWPYGVSALNNRWPQIRFIVRRRRLEKGEMGGPALAAVLLIQHSCQLNKLSLPDQREGGEGGRDWLKEVLRTKSLTLGLKRKSIFTWGHNWHRDWISKISLRAHEHQREYRHPRTRTPAAPFSSGTISLWHPRQLCAAALDVKSVVK